MRERDLASALERELSARDWGEAEEIEIEEVSVEFSESDEPGAVAGRIADFIANQVRR